MNLRYTRVTCNNIFLVYFFCATWDGNKVNSDQICNKGGENNNGVRFIRTWLRLVRGGVLLFDGSQWGNVQMHVCLG